MSVAKNNVDYGDGKLNKYHWQEKETLSVDDAIRLARDMDIPQAGARFLLSRSLPDAGEAARYLDPDVSASPDPFLFEQMEFAVERVRTAVEKKAKIMIHGDYDVDGISGTALLYSYLCGLFPEIFRFLPDRKKDGYGLSARAVQWALDNGIGLVIAVDCGTSDGVEVSRLLEHGVDVIICDHHEFPDEDVPGIVLNPMRESENYPSKSLCGAGVAFKLAQALWMSDLRSSVSPDDLLDLLALATVGDLVPLTDENRYYVKEGLKKINDHPRAGLRALINNYSRRNSKVTSGVISFQIAPRINAPGRISNARPALELLLSDDPGEARELSLTLERENLRRRELTEIVESEVMIEIQQLPDALHRGGFIIDGRDWDEGVLGIAASRVVDAFGRPAILISTSGELAKGSGRSVPGINLKETLDRCGGMLVRYGGHSQAVGLTIKKDNIDDFKTAMQKELNDASKLLPGKAPLNIDSYLALQEATMELAEFLSRCEPFGYGNREPIWRINRLKVLSSTCIVGKGHIKMFFEDDKGDAGEAIFFNKGLELNPISLHGKWIDIAGALRIGYFQNRYYPEIRVKDIMLSPE